jgi:hypothetical protein
MNFRNTRDSADFWSAPGSNGGGFPNTGDASNSKNEHDALVARMLGDRRKEEALEWLKGRTSDNERLIGGCETHRESIAFVKKLYTMGAVEVTAVHIRTARKPM